MTTKEEKARLTAIRVLMVEVVSEIDEILGETKEREFVTAKVKKEKPPDPPPPKDTDVMNIGDLNIGDTGIIIEAEILDIEKNSGKSKAGKPYEVLKASLNDGSGPIKLVLWNDQVEAFDGLELNDVIRVEAWKVEKGYKGGVFELVFGQFGTITNVNIKRHIL